MPDYDFAILGDGTLSALLAGLLAAEHGKRVLRVADPVSPLRLPRALAIALPFATRPASWRLVRQAEAETLALMRRLGAADRLSVTTMRIVADQPETAAALAHLSGLARGYGMHSHAGEFQRVTRLGGEMLLDGTDATQVTADRVRVGRSATGGATLDLDGAPVEVEQIVLADDEALLRVLPEIERPAVLRVEPMTATLTAPARRLAAPVMRFPDRGVTLAQGPDRAVLALVAGDAEVEARLASCLTGPFPLARRATSRFRRVVTTDGAPLIGALAPSQLFVLAGLGEVGPFLAPPLARILAGVATDDETAWFAAHDPSQPSRTGIAEIAEVAA